MYKEIANSHPSLQRGKVWCRTCKKSKQIDPAEALKTGWPKCCGYTMTIDSPAEQAKFDNSRKTLNCIGTNKCQANPHPQQPETSS